MLPLRAVTCNLSIVSTSKREFRYTAKRVTPYANEPVPKPRRKRYDNGTPLPNWLLIIVTLVLGAVVAVVSIIVSARHAQRPATITISDSDLRVSSWGAGSITVPLASITDVQLLNESPWLSRISGTASGAILAGRVSSSSHGAGRAYLNRDLPPFIRVDYLDNHNVRQWLYFNSWEDSAQTAALFEQLSAGRS